MNHMIKKIIRKATPSNDYKPRSFALSLGMGVSLPILWGLALLLPLALLGGTDIGSFAASYFAAITETLSPFVILILVYWLMYWYIYSVCAPMSDRVAYAKTLARIGIFAIRHFFSGGWLPAFTHRGGIAGALIYPIDRIATAVLRLRRSLAPPRHLALGWIPGAHPHLVYH